MQMDSLTNVSNNCKAVKHIAFAVNKYLHKIYTRDARANTADAKLILMCQLLQQCRGHSTSPGILINDHIAITSKSASSWQIGYMNSLFMLLIVKMNFCRTYSGATRQRAEERYTRRMCS